MATSLRDRWKTRIKSFPVFLKRAAADRRHFVYDLLPLFSTPRARDKAASFVALSRPKTQNFTPSDEARAWHTYLVRDGITPLLPAFDPEKIAAMCRYFEEAPCVDPYRAHLGRFRYDAPADPETNMGYYDTQQILHAPHLLGLFNDARVLQAAEMYLGCKPLLDNLGVWWSYGDRPAAKGTQRFHRDFDAFRGFKMFIYLTDVGAESGPHVFMKGTHRSPLLDTGAACADEVVRTTFGQDREVSVTGPAGSWFLADTFGFHKGMLPRRGLRLLASAQFNVNASPHLPRPAMLLRDSRYDFAINRLLMG